ncbi:MAG TPA: carbamoyltransferase HypF [Nocardioidaceae bacterium]|nr:carbamoyltransferase HypF [Nocardioidaceae bacterium]
MTLSPERVRITTDPRQRARRRFHVRGMVQGVGFRPFVYATASSLSLSGTVGNDSTGVVVEVEGAPSDLAEFARRLERDAPPLAVIDDVQVQDLSPLGGTGFHIAASTRTARGRTLASPDVATCGDCLRELADPGDRRYRHPFITCTNCGPRFTIIEDLPYDRAATTMRGFTMCARCHSEYADPADRRFHAQPIACPDCGPRLELVTPGRAARRGEDALVTARAMLADGGIVAVKGLGGYHLACDARDESAVAELRRRKRRGGKPFAVMVRDVDAARGIVSVDDTEAALLTGPRRPIVLLERGAVRDPVAPSVAPGNPDLGILLPYTPLHVLLLGLEGDPRGPQALVLTSGNLGGEPIVYDDEEALGRLRPLVDGWLRHDRPIRVPCDDSVVRVVDGVELPIRRSRGYAPMPVALPFDVPATLAVGADLKNTCAVAEGRYAWLSQHVGDMDDLATLRAFEHSQDHLARLTGVDSEQLVADLHPSYRSTAWARQHSTDHGGDRPLHSVQHHHAHVAAVMGEHGVDRDGTVIGIAFDGTGYGTDGAVWGGEVLVAGYGSFRRFAHLGYVPLPGGDATVHRPYRMALAHLHAAGLTWDERLPAVAACPPDERRVLARQLHTGFGCVPTSSMGRLFDAVSALAGVRQLAGYEAEAAIELEAVSRGVSAPTSAYAFGIGDGAPVVIDPAPVVAAVASDVLAGVAAGAIGAAFHAATAAMVAQVASRAREEFGLHTVALTGGVFQNALLLSATRDALRDTGFTVLTHRRIPPNDGGLALGQVLAAAAVQR